MTTYAKLVMLLFFCKLSEKEYEVASIRIVSIPPGFAPEEIRQHWIDVVIPLPTEKELSDDPPSKSGIGNANEGGYVVRTSQAIYALEVAGKLKAARYWRGFPLGGYLVFKRDVCEVIE
jgi:hypothetical protein